MNSLLHDVSLLELELFVRAGNLRSLRELSRQTGLKPAHVSKIIKRLEIKLGQKLLKRSVSGVILTREGVNLRKTALKICEIAAELEGSPESTRKTSQRVWTVGANSFLTTHFISDCVTDLGSGKDDSRFRLLDTTHPQLVALGLNGVFELAVHVGPLEWTRSWTSTSLGSLRWRLFSRKDHPLGREATPEQIMAFPFVTPTYWTQEGFLVGSDQCPLPWTERIMGHETATAGAGIQIILRSDQLIFVPEIVASREWARGEIQEVRVPAWPIVQGEVFLSVRNDLVPQTFHRRLIGVMKERLGS